MFTALTAIFAMAGVFLVTFVIGGIIFESHDWGGNQVEDFVVGLILVCCIILSLGYSAAVMVYI